MMNFNFSVGLLICIAMLSMVIILYMYDPDIIYSKLVVRYIKTKGFLLRRFDKFRNANKKKGDKLDLTIRICEEAVAKYVNKKNLSTLKKDETLRNLLFAYRELMNIKTKAASEVSLEQIENIWDKIEDLYFPDMDPYYNQEDFI